MFDSISIHPTAVIESGAQLDQGVIVGPYCHIGAKAVLQSNVKLHSHVVVAGRTTVGANSNIYPFAMLGGPPQDTKYKGEDTALVIGNNTLIREYATMHIASVSGDGVTRIGNNCMFMVGAHVAHDCQVGNHVLLTNNATLGGHVQVGNYVVIGGLSAVHQHARVGAYAMVGGMTGVEGDVIPYAMAKGDRAQLNGLNVIGLERRGFSKHDIMLIRRVYQYLFENKSATFAERLAQVKEEQGQNVRIAYLLEFIETRDRRSLVMAA